jgi:uncharacterized SAM-binding protein YcdF (DUF218 family)
LFPISNFPDFLFHPTSVVVGLVALALVLLLARSWRAGLAVGVVAIVFFVTAASPFYGLILRPLEDRFSREQSQGGRTIEGIVVLGGFHLALTEFDAARFRAAVFLAERHPQARVLFVGITADHASIAQILMARAGIRPERIVTETVSRNTAENAAAAKSLASPKSGEKWILVTSAFHMARAVGCFRAVGFPVEPAPIDFHPKNALRLADRLEVVRVALREYVALVAYWVTGLSSGLFPGKG